MVRWRRTRWSEMKVAMCAIPSMNRTGRDYVYSDLVERPPAFYVSSLCSERDDALFLTVRFRRLVAAHLRIDRVKRGLGVELQREQSASTWPPEVQAVSAGRSR